jgi:hypothetical protein
VAEEEREQPPIAPDGKLFGEGRFIGVTDGGLPIPRSRPSPPHTKRNSEDGGPDVFPRSDEYRARRAAWDLYRSRQRKASRRPGWWSPNGVIDRLEDGESITTIIEQAVKDCGGRVKLRILFRDLQKWKKLVRGFKEDYQRATHLYDAGQLPQSRWELFFKTMAAFDGKVEMACAALGIGAKVVYGMLDPQFKATYSKPFAEQFKRAELQRMAPIRAQLLNNAEKPNADPKVQLAVLENAMPALHGKKKTVAVEGGVDLRLRNAATEQQAQRDRALFAGREPKALPAAVEPATIDVTPTRRAEELRAEN